jgi:hypothetical protein
MMDKMINTMMKRYQMFAWLGFIIVIAAFVFALSGANANATFFAADKATREAAGTGSALALANAARHTISAWVPSFKFVGLGILLGAIIMGLGTIVKTLRDLGAEVTSGWPKHLNPGVPEKPLGAKLFPMIMMMGWMILIIGFIWALVFATGNVGPYWNNAIATELNPAQPGSSILNSLQLIQASLPWFSVLRFAGMALLFSGVTLAITVIIRTLQFQENALEKFIQAQST